MILAIQDANILIDLLKSGMMETYFCLGIETHTTDLVLAEVRQPMENYVLRGQLKVTSLSAQEIADLLVFKAGQPPGLTLEDCSVLQLALQKKAVLLTGDNKLRNHANKCKVDAHGILWLMDLFLEEKLLNFATAADCLDRLMKSNPRLPNDECQRRKKIWAEGRGIIPPRPPKK